MTKRTDYINWDQMFMGVALLVANRSKDPSTQVGSVIVSPDNKIVSTGYNGLPNGCSDDEFPWEREGDFLDVKYTYITHSEINCIINSYGNLRNHRLYVTLFPCSECAKVVIQSGIKEVIYLEDKYHDTPSAIASRRMFNASGVSYKQYKLSGKRIILDV